jgi:antitoxin component of MazEF toxin-antitoxin module
MEIKSKTIKRKIFKQGNSICISLPFKTVEKLNLKVGDIIEAKIKKSVKK